MKAGNGIIWSLTFFVTLAIILSSSESAIAVDDGARTYWKMKEGTHVVSFQYLNLDIEASGSQQFAPGQYIYANSDIDADIFIANYVLNMTWLNRPSSISLAVAGGDVNVNVNTALSPPTFLPVGVVPGPSFGQTSTGFADPALQLVVNLFGAPPLKSNVDLLNYEPTWTLDTALMLAFPVGEYHDDKLVNLGLNRWFGRIAFPFKYHFGAFTPAHRASLEIMPAIWLFADNDDFLGNNLENDPMWQIEAHLTYDFTAAFFGSLDILYRGGFQSEINGVEVGDELDIGNLGFTLNYQVTDNFVVRTGFSSNVFGDGDLDSGVLRLQIVYGWHPSDENTKKLTKSGH
jgi:hypothetical protein